MGSGSFTDQIEIAITEIGSYRIGDFPLVFVKPHQGVTTGIEQVWGATVNGAVGAF
jgi:hypothetical protein